MLVNAIASKQTAKDIAIFSHITSYLVTGYEC